MSGRRYLAHFGRWSALRCSRTEKCAPLRSSIIPNCTQVSAPLDCGANKNNRENGFTIVELLIATLVFSMVLLVITIGVLSFTKSYYKGITQSNTQSMARSIIENITQAIQFSGNAVTSPIGTNGSSAGICIGNQRYSYLPGYELVDGTPGTDQTNHALVMDTPGQCNGLNAQDLTKSPAGTELLSPHMRVAKLSVTPVAGTALWKVDVRIVYGDDDLLFSPSGDLAGPRAPDATCHAGFSGSQFCATSELSTVVEKRINSN